MQLQIVSKEIALELRELGFDWKCDYQWNLLTNKHQKQFNQYPDNFNSKDYTNNCCSAPTQALVCKWFRDTHKIYIHHRKIVRGWLAEINNKNAKWHILKDNELQVFKTWEQAEEAGIIKTIEILKTKQNGNN